MMAVALEVTEFRSSAASFLLLVAIAGAGGVVCVFAWRRFNETLFRAEALAEQACARAAAPTRGSRSSRPATRLIR